MKQFKKKLKGMTLVEVVIAIAVFAIMGALLVTAANLINVHLKSTNQLNAKVAEQGPIAEAQYNGAAYPVAGGTTQIEVKYGGSKEIKLNGQAYSLRDEVNDPLNEDIPNDGLNFKFIRDIQPEPTTVPTT